LKYLAAADCTRSIERQSEANGLDDQMAVVPQHDPGDASPSIPVATPTGSRDQRIAASSITHSGDAALPIQIDTESTTGKQLCERAASRNGAIPS
jgi:hypothetical protein